MSNQPSEGNTPPPKQSHEVPREIRFVFVQLLFSLAIGEVARRLAEIHGQGAGLMDSVPAYTHLALAGLTIATSWVGWNGSDANRRITTTQVFSSSFLILLVDVLLVIFYFMLVKCSEVPQPGAP